MGDIQETINLYEFLNFNFSLHHLIMIDTFAVWKTTTLFLA